MTEGRFQPGSAAADRLSRPRIPMGLWHAVFRFFWNTEPLRPLPLIAQNGDGDAIPVQWLPPVSLGGRAHHALAVPPGATVTFTLTAPARVRVTTWCACGQHEPPRPGGSTVKRSGGSGAPTRANPSRADFELQVEGKGWIRRRVLRVDDAERGRPPRWRRIVVRLPKGEAASGIEPVTVRLTATSHEFESTGNLLLWGDPRLEGRRSGADMRWSVAGLLARWRASGLSGVLRHIRDLEDTEGGAAGYRLWVASRTPGADERARMAAEAASLAWQPRFSVLVPVYNTDPAHLRECLESVRRQIYPGWELSIADDGSTAAGTIAVLDEFRSDPQITIVRLPQNAGIAAASNAALAAATGDFVALLDHDDVLAPEALFEVARLLNDARSADVIYSDEDKLDAAGVRCDPHFKPDWSPEHLRSTNYVCHLMVVRAALARDVGGFRPGFEGAQDYDLALRLSERTTRICHVPRVLYHWRKTPGSTAASGLAKDWAVDAGARALADHARRAGFDADVLPGPAPGLYRLRHRLAGRPLVSVVIPTAGHTRQVNGESVDLLVRGLQSIERASTYDRREIVIVTGGSLPERIETFLAGVPHVRVRDAGSESFSFSRRINLGVAQSRGEHVILLNDDVEVLSAGWIEALLEFSQQPDIGAVGARLTYPDGRLQHVGLVLGVCGVAAHAFHRFPGSTPGHGASALIARNYSAVTAACMMTRRDVFERVGGFDVRYPLDFNDIDYCLRIRRAGYRIVYTPEARLTHYEAATSGARVWNGAEAATFRREWADACDNDPYYNPNLSREFSDYRLRLSSAGERLPADRGRSR